MAKHSHKVIVRYQFSDGMTSNVTKLGKSVEECEAKKADIVLKLIALGHTIVSQEIVETKK